MKVADLPMEVIEKIKALHYDRILEKHEGPWKWASEFEYGGKPEFLTIEDKNVLLPIEREHHSSIHILRTIVSEDGNTLTLFLKDTTFTDDPKWGWLEAGRVAVCEKMRGTDFFVATLYHEWMIIENEGLN
jgi:hypothetical protein